MTRIQELEFEILKETIKFLEKNNLTYFMCGGSLLGAIRHKGFIPWDDDIDIGMLREDYDKLVEISKKDKNVTDRYEIQTIDLGTTNYPFVKIIDKKVDVLSCHSVEDKKLFIDIFPFDALPDDYDKSVKIYKKAHLYKKEFCYKNIELEYLKTRKKNPLVKFIELVGYYTVAKSINTKKIYAKEMKMIRDVGTDTQYAGCIVWGYGIGERVLKTDFEIQKVEFEGIQVNGIKGYDNYLKGLYKDYMTIPKETDRYYHEMKIK